jgi:hypothetical protein
MTDEAIFKQLCSLSDQEMAAALESIYKDFYNIQDDLIFTINKDLTIYSHNIDLLVDTNHSAFKTTLVMIVSMHNTKRELSIKVINFPKNKGKTVDDISSDMLLKYIRSQKLKGVI